MLVFLPPIAAGSKVMRPDFMEEIYVQWGHWLATSHGQPALPISTYYRRPPSRLSSRRLDLPAHIDTYPTHAAKQYFPRNEITFCTSDL